MYSSGVDVCGIKCSSALWRCIHTAALSGTPHISIGSMLCMLGGRGVACTVATQVASCALVAWGLLPGRCQATGWVSGWVVGDFIQALCNSVAFADVPVAYCQVAGCTMCAACAWAPGWLDVFSWCRGWRVVCGGSKVVFCVVLLQAAGCCAVMASGYPGLLPCQVASHRRLGAFLSLRSGFCASVASADVSVAYCAVSMHARSPGHGGQVSLAGVCLHMCAACARAPGQLGCWQLL